MMENEDFVVPCTAGFEFITPEMAGQMLEGGNRRNRNLMTAPVRRIIGILERDEWMYDSTDAIGLASDGAVVNGQHRLTAIRDSGIAAWCLVVRGVRPTVVNVIDQGQGRSLAQTLQIDGSYKNPQAVGSAVEWMYRMIHRFERAMPADQKPTVPQSLEILGGHPNVSYSVEPAALVRNKLGNLPLGIWTAYHYAFATADPELADAFYEKLATGQELSDGDPALALQDRLNEDRVKAKEKQLKGWQRVTFLVQAWESSRTGDRIAKSYLRAAKSGPGARGVPTVSGVPWLMPDPPASEEVG